MFIKPRSIPSRSGFTATGHKGREARQRLLNQRIKDERESYDKKKEELQSIVSKEAKILQAVNEQKETSQLEVNTLSDRKTTLNTELSGLNEEIPKAHKTLKDETNRKAKFKDVFNKELAQDKKKITLSKNYLGELTNKVQELEGIAKELGEYVVKQEDARVSYLDEKEKLDSIIEKGGLLSEKAKVEMNQLKEKNSQLDDYRGKMKDMYGQLTTTLGYVRQMTEAMNERMKEEGVPYEFELPPKKITKIQF